MSTKSLNETSQTHSPTITWLCPSWCVDDHAQAIEEGCPPDAARQHHSRDMVGVVDDKRHAGAGDRGWSINLAAAPSDCSPLGRTTVELQLHAHPKGNFEQVTLHLATGEARTLARQLTWMADQEDLGLPAVG